MSIWSKIIESIGGNLSANAKEGVSRDASKYAIVDCEVSMKDKRVHDIGALRWDGATFHAADKHAMKQFLDGVDYLCGHNIIHYDAKYLFGDGGQRWAWVDTLYVSPLLFPERPYHRLLKDDKLVSEQMNNPVNDCEKAHDLLMEEVTAWNALSERKQAIYTTLLHDVPEFQGFMQFVGAKANDRAKLTEWVREEYRGKICEHADVAGMAQQPTELAFALALIDTIDYRSITPQWVLHNYPNVENVVRLLRHTRCEEGCAYCNRDLDVHHNLKQFFGYGQFRTYEGEPLQENAARAAVEGKSLLAIFPTGGGKSLTFQLPALMEGRTVHGLTVVISPLQSLMKDQVDNLAERGITDAVTINGLLDPISRSLAIQRVQDGDASLLYIAPEMLRSKTIEKILLARHVVRFVIDEAHCFSSWGQDFRVDYLYIGKFISEYQQKKRCRVPIPVSCFTATAKQKVVQDICDYFKQMLNLNLQLFASTASRTNLRYSVIHADTDEDKYTKLRSLIAESNCPTIVYVSRTKRTRQLAEKLTRDGFKALPFNGQMDADDKIANQDAFMSDKVRIIVATSAFGMGVDKSDVGLVVHYDISDSLENYVQEAGRAGRDPHLEARCFVLYSDADLDKHFILLNQTKLSISEIQQVWKAVKEMTKQRMRACCSALEIARKAGWDDSVSDIETRVRTALAALEQAGYLERGNNVPHVYATGITVKDMDEAHKRITESLLFENDEVEKAVRIIKSLISQKHIAKAQDAEAESRVDYLADILGLNKWEVVSAVERMRQEGILADTKDMSAYLNDVGESENKSRRLLERFSKLERYILNKIPDDTLCISCKQLNDNAQNEGIATSTEKDIRTLLYFLTVKGYTRKKEDAAHNLEVKRQADMEATLNRFEKRLEICRFAVEWLYRFTSQTTAAESQKNGIQFSVVELLNDLKSQGQNLFGVLQNVQLEDVEEALLYLSKIGALKLEGGFLVLYNAMDIRRIKDNRLRYKQDDYRMLNEFYKQKIQQVHIVGEYANLMVRDYDAALRYVQDYFQMDYKRFVAKYFKGNRLQEIDRNVTPEKYEQLFGTLSPKQMEIISDKESRCIVVAAGPGSGKTRVLVHKLASLLLLEDVKHEQLLMLTFSRAAAIEFKQRLMGLIGNAAHFVEIKTFHSYCFDLLGRVGNLDDAKDVVSRAAQMISEGEVEPNRIAKTVLVIDEAQDMSSEEYALVRALMNANEEMRVIAVGDDDQNIYEFRGSNSQYMAQLLKDSEGRFVEMTENYRSSQHVVGFANAFVKGIYQRMKNGPIVSMNKNDGFVGVTQHASTIMYKPLVDELLSHRGQGSMCVLTQTNEEAVIVVALLRKYGLQSKLIQSMDSFRFWNIAEIRMFLKSIETKTHTPLIADDVWDEAKQKTFTLYSTSESLPYIQRCIQLFEQTYRAKYLTDFKEYVFESSVEDFCDLTGAEVVVSTIHKAKGREFDNVYMLLSEFHRPTDDMLRRYYVGMTRAKNQLFIHTNSTMFNGFHTDRKIADQKQYEMPEEVVLQLSHKDVNLGFFKSRKKEILALRAGGELRFDNNYLVVPNTNLPVAQLSQKMQTDLLGWADKNYFVTSATIRFIVAWRPKDAPKEEKEHAVLLVDLNLKKMETH
ncbi:MAG: RecQ family ATP-dependent DNA helicase [Paludibacteraceae bacterium]|nr:RecQ family ATP-dependent DNA helicase [Paludibacteraceae bacterium]